MPHSLCSRSSAPVRVWGGTPAPVHGVRDLVLLSGGPRPSAAT